VERVDRLLGKSSLGVDNLSPVSHPVGDVTGYHVLTGKHDVTEYDWSGI